MALTIIEQRCNRDRCDCYRNRNCKPPDNSVAIGNNARIFDSNGGSGSGDIAIGNGARINNYADQSASIALGQNAQIDNMAGQQEALFSLGQTTFSGD